MCLVTSKTYMLLTQFPLSYPKRDVLAIMMVTSISTKDEQYHINF